MANSAQFIQQLGDLIAQYESFRARAMYDDLSDLGMEGPRLAARLQAAFDRITSPNDSYGRAAEVARIEPPHVKVVTLTELAYALRDDLNAGWLQSVTELVHAETSTGILQIAQDLMDGGYTAAAAVTAGTALELHLRDLARQQGINTEDAKGKPRKADQLRIDLHSKTNTTTKTQDRRISFWLTVRNEAAHGNTSNYTVDDVSTTISEVGAFINALPA